MLHAQDLNSKDEEAFQNDSRPILAKALAETDKTQATLSGTL